jgi:hypothetical protein
MENDFLNPGHSVGLEMAQGHNDGAQRPASFPAQGHSGLASSVRPKADVARLARALAGAMLTRCAVTACTVREIARPTVACRWTESGTFFG